MFLRQTRRLGHNSGVSLRLFTWAARVRSQVRSCRIFDGQSDTRFSPSMSVSSANSHSPNFFPFPYHNLIQFNSYLHASSTAQGPIIIVIIIRGWYNRHNSGWRIKWIQSRPTLRIKKRGRPRPYLA
jgi:hypothetical protein